ncbi:MAG: DUF2726 domain-containing protein [Marinobacter sp.]|nr:DUF2726 domain-containing protein [Marinobacter sp.]
MFEPLFNALLPLIVMMVLIGGVVAFIGAKKQGPLTYPYRKNKRLMTEAEASFLRVLELALPAGEYRIFGKVRVEDLISVKRGLTRKQVMSARNRIKSRHIDIVIVDAKTFEPRWAVELDDKSHAAEARKKRDDFLNKAFEAAGFPLVRFVAKRAYSSQDILSQLGLLPAEDCQEQPLESFSAL